MTAAAVARLMPASVMIAGYRAQEILAYHARDPAGSCERVDGTTLFKALVIGDVPAVLEISLEHEGNRE